MSRRNRKRNLKAKRAQHTRNVGDSGTTALGYNSPTGISFRASSPSPTHAPSIYSLPPELLCEIFILALLTDEELCKWSQTYPLVRPHITNPFTFCAVCSLWRSLTFSTPQLWQQVFVLVSARTVLGCRAKRKLVQWINRAPSLPLTLYIFCHSIFHEGYLAPIVSVLNDYATRWKALHLQSLEDSPLPLLCFGGRDSLRRAYFRKLVDWPQNRTIPWAQLTHLQICADMSCQQATSILGRCSKLVQLSIRVGDTNLVTANHVTLHDLVTFSVKSYHLSEILGALSLPSLRDLHLYDLSSTDLPSLLNLLTRSSCTLDTLAVHERFPLPIHDRLLRQRHYLRLLHHRSCNFLTSLRIRGRQTTWDLTAFDTTLLHRLTLHRNDSLCPRLKFLKVDCCIISSPSALLKMVESRLGPHTGQEQLQHFRFWIKHQDDIEKLEEVGKKNGMEYNHQRIDSTRDFDIVSLWRFGSGYGTKDLDSTFDD